jgi:hypothetical protein
MPLAFSRMTTVDDVTGMTTEEDVTPTVKPAKT